MRCIDWGSMQYISSIIVSWAPFLADPDFQLVIITLMTLQLCLKIVKKSIKVFATTIKYTSVAAIVGFIIYLALEKPQEQTFGDKVEKALFQLKSELPSFVSNVAGSLETTPKT